MEFATIIGWLISALGIGGITSAFVNRKINEMRQRQEADEARQSAVEKGVQALLRAGIIGLYNKYIEKGYIPIYERENLEHMYDEYKALGGNGVIEDLVEKLRDLPTPR